MIKLFKKRKRKKKKRVQTPAENLEFSKRVIADIRLLLWIVTVGSLLLAVLCIFLGFAGSLPWISSMVSLPWAAHGTVCAFYLNMAKSDHREGGITFEAAKATEFKEDNNSWESPAI